MPTGTAPHFLVLSEPTQRANDWTLARIQKPEHSPSLLIVSPFSVRFIMPLVQQPQSKAILFVPGIFGWGPDELPISYFAGAAEIFDKARFTTIREVKCGPVSSFHDRACELYAQVKGVDIDYGEKHSRDAGHDQKVPLERRPHAAQNGILQDWGSNNPIILIGHSAGAHTCLKLQELLAADYWGHGTSHDWIEAIICISGVLNGSTLTYYFGCDPASGLLVGNKSRLIGTATEVAHVITPVIPHGLHASIDPWLDHWTNGTSRFVDEQDNLAYDLTLKGCRERNGTLECYPNTYYLSLVTSRSNDGPEVLGKPIPVPSPFGMNFLLRLSADYQSHAQFVAPNLPIPDWGIGDFSDTAWQENDGAVSAISQRYPFSGANIPAGQNGFLGTQQVQKGNWYFENVEEIVEQPFDHLDPVFGARMKVAVLPARTKLYQKLDALLR